MSIQEILDAIDAEIAKTQAFCRQIKLGTKAADDVIATYTTYIDGLRFAKDLIEEAEEVGS